MTVDVGRRFLGQCDVSGNGQHHHAPVGQHLHDVVDVERCDPGGQASGCPAVGARGAEQRAAGRGGGGVTPEPVPERPEPGAPQPTGPAPGEPVVERAVDLGVYPVAGGPARRQVRGQEAAREGGGQVEQLVQSLRHHDFGGVAHELLDQSAVDRLGQVPGAVGLGEVESPARPLVDGGHRREVPGPRVLGQAVELVDRAGGGEASQSVRVVGWFGQSAADRTHAASVRVRRSRRRSSVPTDSATTAAAASTPSTCPARSI